MQNASRIGYLSAAKAVGIVLVTIGHAEPLMTTFPVVWKTIYAFHMPLFFLLTGLFAAPVVPLNRATYGAHALRQVRALFVPYVVMSLVFTFIKLAAAGNVKRQVPIDSLARDVLLFPSDGPALYLWFIYTLLVIRLAWPLVARAPRWLVIAALAAFQLASIDIPIFLLGYVGYYLAYYWLGAQLGQHLDALREQLARIRWSLLAAAVFVALDVYAQVVHPTRLPAPLRLPLALSGTWLVLAACRRFESRLAGPAGRTLDRQSFDIYLLQYLFIFPMLFVGRRLGLPDPVTIAINIALGLVGPLSLVRAGRRIAPALTTALLGPRRGTPWPPSSDHAVDPVPAPRLDVPATADDLLPDGERKAA